MPGFDIDDILADYDSKKNGASPDSKRKDKAYDVDDILKEALGDMPKKKVDISEVEARHRREKANAEEKRKAEEAERARQEKLAEQRKAAEERERRTAEERRRIEEERRKKAKEEEEKRAARRMAAEEEARKKREAVEAAQRKAELKQRKAEEEAAEKKKLAEEAEKRKADEAARIAALAEEEREKAEKEAERKRAEEEISERKFASKSIVFEEVPIELPKIEEPVQDNKPVAPTTSELELEESIRRQKIESDAQKRLEREVSLDDPDDFLTALNPYDTGKTATLTQMIDTIPAQQLSGDTVGVAQGDLKKLARENSAAAEKSVEDIVNGETMIMPGTAFSEVNHIDLEKTFVLKDADVFPGTDFSGEKNTVEISKPSDPILDSINKTIEQKRLEDIKADSPYTITAQLEKVKPYGVNIDLTKAAMPQKGHVPVTDPTVSEQKMKYLSSKRKRKISDFVLEDITDDDDYEDYDYNEDELETADEDDGQLWTDLTETHKSLRIRFVLLLILTVIVCGITMAQEFGATLNLNIFGQEIGFLDKRYDTDGFIYFNLISGVIGAVLCYAAIQNGIIKLFKRKGDCDSIAAVSTVVSVGFSVIQLINTDYIQRSRAYILIPVALAGLLFNTLGKLSMISRARRNFRFISANANRYYVELVDNDSAAGAFTKGVVGELPELAVMRKTEYLTDFLRKTYCEDKADRISRVLAVFSLIAGVIMGLLVYLVPNTTEGMQNNPYWAITVMNAFVCMFAPFSLMFIVNNPLRRAAKALEKSGSTILGYSTAEEFSRTNAVMTDVSSIFPASSVECTNLKPCRLQNSFNNITLDQAIILAASLSIKSGSILSRLFFEMIGGNEELLAEIDGCVYEDNMGILGWYGNKRLIMGNREHMKHHSIKVPEMSAIAKYSRNGSDAVYLAVGGELAIIFFIRLTANENIRSSLRELTDRDVSIVLKTTDSLVTVGKIADLFDIDPEKIKIIGSNLHEQFEQCTRYTSSGCGAVSGNGSFSGFSRAICACKKLMRDVNLSQTVMLAGVFLAVVFGVFLSLSTKTLVFSPTVLTLYQLFWMLPVLIVQAFRKY